MADHVCSSPIIRLNIGGRRYDTTESTLSSHGENFFTALLAGRLDTVKDEDGAIFIDRDGEYFAPIIHFLRTGRVEVPPCLHRGGVTAEAEFFCITDFVEALAQEDREREEKERLAALDKGLRKIEKGVYICKELSWGFMFEEKELLAVRSDYVNAEGQWNETFIKAHAEARPDSSKWRLEKKNHDLTPERVAYALMVARAFNRKQLGAQWSQDRMMYAAFYESYVVRGSYTTDGQTVVMELPISSHGASTSCISVLSEDGKLLCVDGGKILTMNQLFPRAGSQKGVLGILNSFVPFVFRPFV